MKPETFTVQRRDLQDEVHTLPHGGTYDTYDGRLTIHQYKPRVIRVGVFKRRDQTIYDSVKLVTYARGEWSRVIVS